MRGTSGCAQAKETFPPELQPRNRCESISADQTFTAFSVHNFRNNRSSVGAANKVHTQSFMRLQPTSHSQNLNDQ